MHLMGVPTSEVGYTLATTGKGGEKRKKNLSKFPYAQGRN
jgi:hypothetical protein